MFAWYAALPAREKRTVWGCFGGWALDAFDVQIFSFLIGTLIVTFGISRAEAGVLGTTTLVASALGGWIAGALADRVGRLRIMQWTVAWYACFTFLSGFATSYDQLLVTRSLQGLGFGGEWACGAVLVGEIIRPAHRGKAVGCVQSGYAVGWGAAALVSLALFHLLPPSWAWRAAFWTGLLPALLVVYLRRALRESEVFVTARATGRPMPLAIFRPAHLRVTALASLLASGLQGSGYAIVTWLPTLMTARHLPPVVGSLDVLVVTIGAFGGYIGSAYLSDAVGRRPNFVLFSLSSLLLVLLYTGLPLRGVALVVLCLPLGFFAVGSYAALGPCLTELFPTKLRATGQSFAYNAGRSIGALSVAAVGALSGAVPLGQAIALFAVGGYLVAIIAALLLPETRARTLDAADAVPTPPSAPPARGATTGVFR